MKKLLYTLIISLGITVCFWSVVNAQGGVSINVAGAPPDNSALLDISGTNKGLLIPRMTTLQRNAIANPAQGLQIYNTDCGVYNYNAGSSNSPNWVTLNSSNALIAGVSISASPVGAICAGTSVTFTATPASGINSPNYQWQVNGSNVGTNSSSYSSSALNNGDVVSCILTSTAPCVIGSPATSNTIAMTVNPIPSTPGSISGSATACPGTSGNVYSVSPVAGATSYNWTVPNDAIIASGAGNTSITVTFGSNSGNISVVAMNACGSSSASTLAVTMQPAIPGTPGIISGSSNVNSNSNNNLYFISPVSNATTYTWTVPAGAFITAGQGTDSVLVNFGSNSGSVSVTAGNSCGNSAASSLVVTVCSGYSSGPQTFSYTGNQQIFTVPACVYSITITAYGAQGVNSGGLGGSAQGTLSVTPGSILYVYVGGQNGFNGGGTGGGGNNGGDMSDVRQGGTSFSNTIIVAGGGGGSFTPYGLGGAGGGGSSCANGAAGAAGLAYVYNNTSYSGPGADGTCNGGGAGGNGYGGFAGGGGGGGLTSGGSGGASGGYGNYGGSGSAGQGGAYGYNGACGGNVAGGGGGGYYGGGGGANGQCQGGGGGGGSSWASSSLTNLSFTGGVQSGNGQVVINW